jgi:hypothetical protein
MKKIVDPLGQVPDTWVESIEKNWKAALNYFAVSQREDGVTLTNVNYDDVFYRKKDGQFVSAAVPGQLPVSMYSPKANANFRKSSDGTLYENSALTIAAGDDTTAIQKAIDMAVITGKDVFLEQKNYLVTDTLNIPASAPGSPIKSIRFIAQGSGYTSRLKFVNSTADKPMFTVSPNMTYMVFENITIEDSVLRTSKGFVFTSTRTTGGAPLWKITWRNFRIENFKVGMHFMGDADYLQDAYLDGCTFIHGKFRNCQTSVIYENIQAVNHAYYNVDFENDATADITGKWKMFHLKRGTQINHYGGSVIGAGPYVYIEMSTTGGEFQQTTEFNTYGCRCEQRESATPIFWHAETSSISTSNVFKVNVHDFTVVNSYVGSDDVLFAKLGGAINFKCDGVRTSRPMYIYGAITTGLASNLRTGNILVRNSNTILYKKYVPSGTEYGSAGVGVGDRTEIPCRIEVRNEGAIQTTDGSGYINFNNYDTQVLAAGWNPYDVKRLVYKPPNNNGFGSGANPAVQKLILPKYARPLKFALLKNSANIASNMQFTFSVEISSVTTVVAQITTTARMGYFESYIQPPSGVMTEMYVDGTTWDGKCAISKLGTVNAFDGVIIIEYI